MSLHVEGTLSTKAVIEAKRRKVSQIYIEDNKRSKDIGYIYHLAMKNEIPVEYVTRDFIDEKASGKTHGGVMALVKDRDYQELSTITNKKEPFIAILEGIEDPFNFGYCLRSLYAAGCDGVIVESRNWTSVVDVVARSSAGASEYLDIHVSDDLVATMQQLKKQGFKIYGANRKNASDLYATEFENSLVIAIGGEKRGLSSKVAKECQENIFIPYANDFRNAINGSSATAIIAFEIFRQRRGAK